MSWVRRLLAHFPLFARHAREERERARRIWKTVGEADPVIREYRKLDGALVIHIERKPR